MLFIVGVIIIFMYQSVCNLFCRYFIISTMFSGLILAVGWFSARRELWDGIAEQCCIDVEQISIYAIILMATFGHHSICNHILSIFMLSKRQPLLCWLLCPHLMCVFIVFLIATVASIKNHHERKFRAQSSTGNNEWKGM